MSKPRLTLLGLALVAVLAATLIVTRYHVVQCYSHSYCMVLDRWTGHIQARYPQAAR